MVDIVAKITTAKTTTKTANKIFIHFFCIFVSLYFENDLLCSLIYKLTICLSCIRLRIDLNALKIMKLGKYLVLDAEFSGQYPGIHGIIEIAFAVLDSKMNVIDTFVTDVKPPENTVFDQESVAISGITMERVMAGMNYPDLCQAIIDFLKLHFNGLPIVVGQFYPADFGYINHLFGYCGYGRELYTKFFGNDYIDTKVIVNAANAKANMLNKNIPFPITSLSKKGGLSEKLGVSEYQAHTALGDVMATREVLIKLLVANIL